MWLSLELGHSSELGDSSNERYMVFMEKYPKMIPITRSNMEHVPLKQSQKSRPYILDLP